MSLNTVQRWLHWCLLGGCADNLDYAYNDEKLKGLDGEEAVQDQSPIEQVALTVSTVDDPSIPVYTFRMWTLGILSCVLLAFLNQFFSYRREPLTITAISAQIAALPLGRIMAATLPTKLFKVPFTNWTWTMNPGPFSIKEHVLITIFANSGAGGAYAINIVTIVKAFYKKKITFFVGLLITITTQVCQFSSLCLELFVEIEILREFVLYSLSSRLRLLKNCIQFFLGFL